MAPSSTLSRLTAAANDAFLAPLIALPNLGLAAVNAAVGGTARLAEAAAKAGSDAGLGVVAEAAEDFSRRLADRAVDAARTSTEMASDAVGRLVGKGGELSANTLLARTLLERTTATGALPLAAAVDAFRASRRIEAVRDAGDGVWQQFSQLLDPLSKKGVLPGKIGAKTAAELRFGFYFMTTQGPLGAVAQDVSGITGGGLALALGDLDWLAQALPRYRRSMEYVHDKAVHGEVQPESDFPLSAGLAESATATVESFPDDLAEALASGEAREALRALVEKPSEIATLLGNYPGVEFRVVSNALAFTLEAYFEAADAERYSLCELAILQSALSDEEKDGCLAQLRETAPNTTVQFEYYVPLLVPKGGGPEDQAFRRTAGGEIIDTGAVAESVFEPRAIERAQAIASELLSYRPFLWLYRDEARAREKNRTETIRKFGPEVARRIEEAPLYPLTAAEVAELTAGGPRPAAEVNRILLEQLHRRGLGEIADRLEERAAG